MKRAPDAQPPTLHVRCGTDIRGTLADAGFVGEFLAIADPLVVGPLPAGADFIRVRARFLAESFDRDAAEIEAAETRALARLDEVARSRAHRIVLWFEHDSYDQLILARILAALTAAPPRRRAAVELICIDSFPGIERFIGLGQLGPDALRRLWKSRRVRLTPAQRRLGVVVWDALRATDPSQLLALVGAGTPALPIMARALRRHLQELPWSGDGLGLTQRLALQALASGPRRGGALFAAVQAADPLPFLGDSILYAILADMARATSAPFASDDKAWPKRTLTLNETGRALLAGGRDWLSCGPRERWVGGVRIAAGAPVFRWSPEANAVV